LYLPRPGEGKRKGRRKEKKERKKELFACSTVARAFSPTLRRAGGGRGGEGEKKKGGRLPVVSPRCLTARCDRLSGGGGKKEGREKRGPGPNACRGDILRAFALAPRMISREKKKEKKKKKKEERKGRLTHG